MRLRHAIIKPFILNAPLVKLFFVHTPIYQEQLATFFLTQTIHVSFRDHKTIRPLFQDSSFLILANDLNFSLSCVRAHEFALYKSSQIFFLFFLCCSAALVADSNTWENNDLDYFTETKKEQTTKLKK